MKQVKSQNSDDQDIEHLIFEVAEHQLAKDFDELYRRLATRTVCIPIIADSLPQSAKAGERYVTTAADQLKMSFVIMPNGMKCAAAATRENAALLQNSFVYIEWLELLRMSQRLDHTIGGVFLQGAKSWVAFDREKVRYILGISGIHGDSEKSTKKMGLMGAIKGIFKP